MPRNSPQVCLECPINMMTGFHQDTKTDQPYSTWGLSKGHEYGKNHWKLSWWLPMKLSIPQYVISSIFIINQLKYSQILLTFPLINGLFNKWVIDFSFNKWVLFNLRVIFLLIMAVSNFWFNCTTVREYILGIISVFSNLLRTYFKGQNVNSIYIINTPLMTTKKWCRLLYAMFQSDIEVKAIIYFVQIEIS